MRRLRRSAAARRVSKGRRSRWSWDEGTQAGPSSNLDSFPVPQIREKRVAQIEIALDAPAAFVLQLAVAIELVDEFPFRFDERQFELIAQPGEFLVALIAVIVTLDVFESVAEMRAHRFDDGLRKLAGLHERLEP